MSPEIIAALVTVIGLLFAALIAARVSYVGLLISKESSVSQFRQAWVDALREDIAELVGRYSTYPRAGHMNAAGRSELDLATATVKARIQMRMNPGRRKNTSRYPIDLHRLHRWAPVVTVEITPLVDHHGGSIRLDGAEGSCSGDRQ